MRRKLHFFNIFPRKITIVYFLGLLAILLTSAFVLIVGLSQIATFNYASANQGIPGISFSEGTMITEHDTRTVYSSRVPATIADAVNNLNLTIGQGKAYPLTLTPVTINQSIPLVVRGIPISVIISMGLAGSQTRNTTDVIYLGYQSEQRLHSQMGSNISIQSPFLPDTMNATVGGIFRTGSEEDYEAIVSLSLGEQLAGLPGGTANAIIAPPSFSLNPSIFSYDYNFNVNYTGPAGDILFIDSSGYVHYSFPISSSKSSNITEQNLRVTLPFGLYNIVMERGGLRTTLRQFVTKTNNSAIAVNSTLSKTNGFLNVIVGNASSPSPILLDTSNSSISPLYFDQNSLSWVFSVPSGAYSLKLQGSTYRLFLSGNATFDASSPSFNSFLNVKIRTQSNQTLGYSITVKDAQSSRIIFSSFSTDSNLTIPVESNHLYETTILTTGNLLIEQNVSITQNTSVIFSVPNIPLQLQNVPIFDYSSLGVGFPSQTASFDYFFGTVSASTLALFSIITLLLILTLLTFDSQFIVSIRNEMHAIVNMFPRARAFFWTIGFPMLLLSIGAGLAGIGISYAVFELLPMTSLFTFMGYGIQLYPISYIAPVLMILSVFSWLRVSFFLKQKVGSTGAV